jgi:DNA-binding NtrC family response regulator
LLEFLTCRETKVTEKILKVLIVDDEAGIRDVLAFQLKDEGFDVVTAEDGTKALDLFSKDTFDVVITDLKMPGISGVEVVRQVKAKASRTIVIVLTGVGSIETAVETMRLGCDDYLMKPLPSLAVIKQAINRCLARREVMRKSQAGFAYEAVEEDVKQLFDAEKERKVQNLEGYIELDESSIISTEPQSVLIVDHDPEFRELLNWALIERGYLTAMTGTGTEALKLINEAEFSGIVMELRLPDMSGEDLLAILHAEKSTTPIFVVSAYAGSLEISRLKKQGACAVIPKPVNVTNLMDVINRQIRG